MAMTTTSDPPGRVASLFSLFGVLMPKGEKVVLGCAGRFAGGSDKLVLSWLFMLDRFVYLSLSCELFKTMFYHRVLHLSF